ncbi:unnamed protein product [Laminaria digitata]
MMLACLIVVSMEGCLTRPRRIASYLPVDRASAFFFLVGAAQRAYSESFSDPALFAGEQAWWCGLLIYLYVCFKYLGRTGRTVLQITGFALLSRWDTDIVIGVAICLGVALLASAEKKTPKRGDSRLGPKALTPSSSVADGMKMFEEVIFRFAALTVVLIWYPHIKFDQVTTPSGTYPGQLTHCEYELIGEVVRFGMWTSKCKEYKKSAFAIILYGRVFGTTLFKACQASMTYLMARMFVTLPVFMDVFPRCKCALTTITANVGGGSSSSASNTASPDSKTKEEVKPDHNEGAIEQIGDGDSEEDVSLRIQLRSMHRSLAAALMIVAIHSSLDPYSRLRNDQRGLCISGEDDEAYSCLHERLLRDLEEVTVACFAMFTLAITRGAQEELAFAIALCGPSRERDIRKCLRMTLEGSAAIALCLYGGIWPYTELVELPPFQWGRPYGAAVHMTYHEFVIAVGLTVLPFWNLVVSFLCGNKIFPLPRWLEDGAIMAFSAYVYGIIFDMRKMIILLSRQLLYYPGTDMALWVPWKIGMSQGILDLLPEMLLMVYQWCSVFESVVDTYLVFSPFCWPTSRHARLGLVSRNDLDRANGKEMTCAICGKSLVDEDGGLKSGLFGNVAGERTAIPVSSTIEGGVTAAAIKTCVRSRCRCKRFLHAGCAATWLNISPECPKCPEYLHGGLDLWHACSIVLAFVIPKPIRSKARQAWWSWVESGLVFRQKAAIYFFDRRLAWDRKEHVLRREYMVACEKVVDTTLRVRDEANKSNSLLEEAVKKLRKCEKEVEAEKAKTKKLVAAVEEKKEALIKAERQPGKRKKAARRS